MHINQLRYFIAVAEQQSFTKAAAQFYISQTAVTQQIQLLEESIGIKLIDRTTRPISLTTGGKAFLREAKLMLEQLDSAIWRSREAAMGVTGSIRVGYTKGYEQSDLPRRLREFHKAFPNVLITCYRDDTDRLATGLMSREYDIIFTWDSTNIRQENSLQVHTVERIPLYVAMYTGHHLARRKSITREDLKGESMLFMSPSSDGDSFGDAYYIQLYQKAGFQPNIMLRTSDYESVLIMVAAEEAICVVPEYCVGKLRSVDNIIFQPLCGEGETEEILVAWNGKNNNPALMRFIEGENYL